MEAPGVVAQVRHLGFDGTTATLVCAATLQWQVLLPPSILRPPFWSQAECI